MKLEKYLQYLRDNPEGYWFKARLYGFGWTPVKWQGWAVTVAFVVALIWVGNDFVKIILLVATLIIICIITGEKLRWSWGSPKNN